jgi:hypothetical protein
MTVEPIKKADPELIKALAREAKDVLDDRAFTTATRALHAQWYGELMTPNMNDVAKLTELVAKLRTLEAIPQMLRHLMDSEKMAQQRGSHAGRG